VLGLFEFIKRQVLVGRKKKKLWQVHTENPKDERDVVIGFDFGTSCTKIVLRDFHRKEAFAVPFDRTTSEFGQYLLPTKIYVNSDGSIHLGKGDTEIDALKVQLIQNPTAKLFENENTGVVTTSLDLAVAYIGLVLIHARNWFKETKSLEYQNINISWQLNIGMSSRSYDDKGLYDVMKRAALAGWNLSLFNKNSIFLSDVKAAIKISDLQIKENNYNDKKEELHPDYVNPVPEIIAEVVGYFRSPMRKDGMYLIVDVGARTLDVSTFILHENEEVRYSILTAEVDKLGAFILHQKRIEACKRTLERNLCKLISICDGISPLPEIEEYLPRPPHKDREAFDKAEEKFSGECSRMIRGVIKETKDRRNPIDEAWEQGFPVFLCGGGAQIDLYQQIFDDIERKLQNTIYQLTFIKKEFPVPDDLKNSDINIRGFNRLAVAYGLSFPKYDIGEIIPPDPIEDLVCNIKIRDIEKFYIDKDMV
jgi:hypothetical protein